MKLNTFAILGVVAVCVATAGCGTLQSPYSKDDPSYRQGEKPSYTIGQMTNRASGICRDGDGDCRTLGKVILTKPSDNISFQIIRRRSGGANGDVVEDIITCASPAEAGKTVSTDGSMSTSFNVKVAGAATPVSGAASQSARETLVVLKSLDAATQYVATASFANCLAYASGMYESSKAAELQQRIFDNAVPIASGASAPKSPVTTSEKN